MKRFADSHIHFYDYDYAGAKRCLDTMHAWGVTDTAVQSLTEYPSGGVAQNLFALYVKNSYKGPVDLRAFGSLHEFDRYGSTPYEKQLDTMLGMGFDGMGMAILNTCAFAPVPVMLYLFNKLKAKKGTRFTYQTCLICFAISAAEPSPSATTII